MENDVEEGKGGNLLSCGVELLVVCPLNDPGGGSERLGGCSDGAPPTGGGSVVS